MIAPIPIGNFDHFVDWLRDPDKPGPVLSPTRFCQALLIDLQTLAEQAHVHRNTIIHAPTSQGVQHFLREALRVITAAADIAGVLSNVIFWYRNEPLSSFGYKTAEQMVSEGRTEAVLQYIASLQAGATG